MEYGLHPETDKAKVKFSAILRHFEGESGLASLNIKLEVPLYGGQDLIVAILGIYTPFETSTLLHTQVDAKKPQRQKVQRYRDYICKVLLTFGR